MLLAYRLMDLYRRFEKFVTNDSYFLLVKISTLSFLSARPP